MPKTVDSAGRTWTYGVEHELADWDTRKGWGRFGRSPENNICNSNGIAVDPTLKSYKFGGEFNTIPSETPEDQGEQLLEILKLHPNAKANWRCGLHVHIRVPGLKDNLPTLRRLARYIDQNTEVYDLVDPLPVPTKEQFPIAEEFKAAKRRYNWMRMSHFTKIPTDRLEGQKSAKTLEKFLACEVPISRTGIPLWHAQPRAAISLRQLLQTDTIEFRHFPATLQEDETVTSVEWCRDYLLAFFNETPAIDVFNERYSNRKFPTLNTIYCHWQEQRWLVTTITKNKREVIEENIKRILAGDSSWPPGETN